MSRTVTGGNADGDNATLIDDGKPSLVGEDGSILLPFSEQFVVQSDGELGLDLTSLSGVWATTEALAGKQDAHIQLTNLSSSTAPTITVNTTNSAALVLKNTNATFVNVLQWLTSTGAYAMGLGYGNASSATFPNQGYLLPGVDFVFGGTKNYNFDNGIGKVLIKNKDVATQEYVTTALTGKQDTHAQLTSLSSTTSPLVQVNTNTTAAFRIQNSNAAFVNVQQWLDNAGVVTMGLGHGNASSPAFPNQCYLLPNQDFVFGGIKNYNFDNGAGKVMIKNKDVATQEYVTTTLTGYATTAALAGKQDAHSQLTNLSSSTAPVITVNTTNSAALVLKNTNATFVNVLQWFDNTGGYAMGLGHGNASSASFPNQCYLLPGLDFVFSGTKHYNFDNGVGKVMIKNKDVATQEYVTNAISAAALTTSTDISVRSVTAISTANDAFGTTLTLRKTRGGAAAQVGDELGYLEWRHNDTTNAQRRAAMLFGQVAAVGSNYVAGNIALYTTNASGVEAARISVAADGTVSTSNTTDATSTTTGAFKMAGGLGVAKTIYANALTTSDLTDASSTTTGSVKIAGGMGVAKTIYANDMYIVNKPVATREWVLANVAPTAAQPTMVSMYANGPVAIAANATVNVLGAGAPYTAAGSFYQPDGTNCINPMGSYVRTYTNPLDVIVDADEFHTGSQYKFMSLPRGLYEVVVRASGSTGAGTIKVRVGHYTGSGSPNTFVDLNTKSGTGTWTLHLPYVAIPSLELLGIQFQDTSGSANSVGIEISVIERRGW